MLRKYHLCSKIYRYELYAHALLGYKGVNTARWASVLDPGALLRASEQLLIKAFTYSQEP